MNSHVTVTRVCGEVSVHNVSEFFSFLKHKNKVELNPEMSYRLYTSVFRSLFFKVIIFFRLNALSKVCGYRLKILTQFVLQQKNTNPTM